MSDDGSDTPTPDSPGKIRLPTNLEVRAAVESTPTVRDDEKPDVEIPAFLKPKTTTIELNIDTSEGPSPVADPSNEPTEKLESLAQPIIPKAPRETAKSPPWPLVIAILVAAMGVVAFLLSR